MFEACTVIYMFLVEIVATLGSDHRLSDDEITDVIEAVVDEMDGRVLDPSVGTARVGDGVEIAVSFAVDESEEWDALTAAASAAKSAFQAAGVGAAGLVVSGDLRSQVKPLQAA